MVRSRRCKDGIDQIGPPQPAMAGILLAYSRYFGPVVERVCEPTTLGFSNTMNPLPTEHRSWTMKIGKDIRQQDKRPRHGRAAKPLSARLFARHGRAGEECRHTSQAHRIKGFSGAAFALVRSGTSGVCNEPGL